MIRSVPATVSVVSALTLALATSFAHANTTEDAAPAETSVLQQHEHDGQQHRGHHKRKKHKPQRIDERIEVVGTAEQQIKQSLGVSFISAEDLARRP